MFLVTSSDVKAKRGMCQSKMKAGYQSQGFIHSPHLFDGKPTNRVARATDIDGGHLFEEDAVTSDLIVTSGRNVEAQALCDVGATRTVDKGASTSLCITTAKRGPLFMTWARTRQEPNHVTPRHEGSP
jgi:hypothetical protein